MSAESLVSEDFGFSGFEKAKKGGISLNLLLPDSICDVKLFRAMPAPSCLEGLFHLIIYYKNYYKNLLDFPHLLSLPFPHLCFPFFLLVISSLPGLH